MIHPTATESKNVEGENVENGNVERKVSKHKNVLY